MELREYDNHEIWKLYKTAIKNNSGSLNEFREIIVERYDELLNEDKDFIVSADRWGGGGVMPVDMLWEAERIKGMTKNLI